MYFVIALIAMILLSPVFIVVTILMYFANEGKLFFVHTRVGLNEKVFNIVKFKMDDVKGDWVNYLSDQERSTLIGSF